MFPTWVDFYFLKTFKRYSAFAKICKSGVLKKVFRLRFRYAVTRGKGGSVFVSLRRDKGENLVCGSRSSSQLRVTPKPTFGFYTELPAKVIVYYVCFA